MTSKWVEITCVADGGDCCATLWRRLWCSRRCELHWA